MSQATARIDQCLFGYDDGHRLLASSIPLAESVALLTRLSDLAPGAIFGASVGYWTGLPLARLGRYALMYTWPAPEMSRPGCVWTHALLFDPSLFDAAADLAFLQRLIQRPAGPNDRDQYREALAIELESGARTKPPLDTHYVAQLLRALYGDLDQIFAGSPGTIDPSLFAIWSQQWPRLRRNFKFQTALTRQPQTSGDVRMDLVLVAGEPTDFRTATVQEDWLNAACVDLLAPETSTLRSFLWRYGADVRKQFSSFQPLCKMKLLHDADETDDGQPILTLLSSEFPGPSDAQRLKQDLVDGLVVPSAQLDLLAAVVSGAGTVQLPNPSPEGIQALSRFWPHQRSKLLWLAEQAVGQSDTTSLAIFETVAEAVPAEAFWEATTRSPRVREQMVKVRPELLLANGADLLGEHELTPLLEFVPEQGPVAVELTRRLLTRDSSQVASLALDRFGATAALEVVRALNSGRPVGRTWIAALVTRSDLLFDSGALAEVTRASVLYDIADGLGWLTDDVARRGIAPWVAAIEHANDDLANDARGMLFVFLFVLALLNPGDPARRVFERTFSFLHGQLRWSRLPWRAQSLLSQQLPEVHWTRNWDTAFRLRVGVVAAYISHEYAPASFGRLESDNGARALLAETADLFKGAKKLAKAVTA